MFVDVSTVYLPFIHSPTVHVFTQDPHYHGPPDQAKIVADGFVKWHNAELFQISSFYNFCLPQSIVYNHASK